MFRHTNILPEGRKSLKRGYMNVKTIRQNDMKVTTITIMDFNNKLEFKVTGEESDNQLLMLGYLEVLKAEIIKYNPVKQHRCRNCGTASKSVYCSVQCSEDAS